MNIRLDEAGKPKRFGRWDAGQLAKPERTAEGFLRVEGVLARTCILHYLNADGSARHELVTPEVLFDDASMRSLSVLALTNNHPDQLLTPETVGTYQIGTVGEPRRSGDRLVSLLGVLRVDAIAAVEGGKQALSCGYTVELDETPGTHSSLTCPECGTSNYDAIQRDRRGNHVAICDAARAGHEARIRLDSAGNARPLLASGENGVVASSSTVAPTPEINPMTTTIHFDATKNSGPITIQSDAADLQAVIARHLAAVKQDAADGLVSERARADAAVKEANTIKTKLDAMGARIVKRWTGLRTKFDAMKARMMDCEECNGTGKVMNDATEGACEYCGGTGKFRMHDAIKAMPSAEGEPTADDDMEEMGDDLSGEPPAEEAQEKAANPEHDNPKGAKKDAAAKLRLAARKVAQTKRADSLARITNRRAKVRADLITAASKHVDAAELAKSNVEIKRAVLVKVAPHLDAPKMDAASVELFFAAEIKRLEGAARADGAGPSIAFSQAMLPGPHNDAAKVDLQKRIDVANQAMYHSHETPVAK